MIEVIPAEGYVKAQAARRDTFYTPYMDPDFRACGATPPPSVRAGIEAGPSGDVVAITTCILDRKHSPLREEGRMHQSVLLYAGQAIDQPPLAGFGGLTLFTWLSTRQLGQVVAP